VSLPLMYNSTKVTSPVMRCSANQGNSMPFWNKTKLLSLSAGVALRTCCRALLVVHTKIGPCRC
jgi:hypothetical protein